MVTSPTVCTCCIRCFTLASSSWGGNALLGLDLHSGHWPTALGLGLVLLLLTSLLAWYSERWLERPLRRWAAKLWPTKVST